jgi:hypothetical protein
MSLMKEKATALCEKKEEESKGMLNKTIITSSTQG